MPINLRTHAHGQGYADLNWLMPETVDARRRPQGAVFRRRRRFRLRRQSVISACIDSVDKNILSTTVGSFGYERFFGMGSTKIGEGTLLYAGEAGTYNGPWANPDDMRKFNGLLRYSQGTATDGFSLTGMAYSNKWNSTDQVPLRAITTGQIGCYGEDDPTDGGDTSRFALSARDGRNRRCRLVEGQRLRRQERPRSVQQLHLLPDQSRSTAISSTSTTTASMSGGERLAHHQRHVRRLADGNHVRHAVPLRRYPARPDRYLSARVPVERPQRQCRRGQRRHLCREHRAMDRLAAGPRSAGAATISRPTVDSICDAEQFRQRPGRRSAARNSP